MGGFAIVEDRPTPKEVYNWRIYTFAAVACEPIPFFCTYLVTYNQRREPSSSDTMARFLVPPTPERPSSTTLALPRCPRLSRRPFPPT